MMCYLSIFALFYFALILRAISKYKPLGTYIRRGDLIEGFLHNEFGGHIFGGVYMFQVILILRLIHFQTWVNLFQPRSVWGRYKTQVTGCCSTNTETILTIYKC